MMMSGHAIVLTTAQEPSSFVLTSGNPEATRLADALRSLRPVGHDLFCGCGPDDPDQWIDETEDPPMDASGMVAVEWKSGVGLVTTDKPVVIEPYVGWCCDRATQRHVIDAALAEGSR